MQRRSQCVSYDPQGGDRLPGPLQVIEYVKVMNRPEQPHRGHFDTSFGKSMRIQFAIVTQYIALSRNNHCRSDLRRPAKGACKGDAIS